MSFPKRASLSSVMVVSYATLLLLVVVGFGSSLYAMMSRSVYQQAEADLLGAAQLLLKDLATNPTADSLEISRTYLERFGRAPRDRAYFAVWNAKHEKLAGTDTLPREAIPADPPPPQHGIHPYASRAYGRHLDVIIATPDGGQLLIGRPLAKEMDGLWRLLSRIVLIGIGCILVGCLAAWWLARMIARPLANMVSTAEQIRVINFSQRLETVALPEEVHRLATVINAMLDRIQLDFDRQSRFTADASHELRTPVAVVLSQAEYTLSQSRENEEYREALQTCLREAQRMRRLTDDLLLLARADTGQLNLKHESVDLRQIAQDGVDAFQPIAAEKQLRLNCELEAACVWGDASRLGQVVSNLVANAVQFSLPHREIFVRTKDATGEALLIVQDQGVGIESEAQPQIFDRFFRADRARTSAADSGAGLGLSLVKEIVAAHGGVVQVNSQLGRGTTMTVRIPLAAKQS